MEAQACSSCNGTGILSPGTEWVQFCPDCLTGNTLALKASGSNLDPTRYPACHYDLTGGCNDQGLFPDGSSCDCDRVSILGFESMGCSHDTAIKVMCALTSCDEGCDDPVRSLSDTIDEIQGGALGKRSLTDQEVGAALNQLVQENPEGFQVALDHNRLRQFL
jgi:hypothetical protein